MLMVTSLEGFRSSIVVSLRLQIKVGTSLLTVLYFPNSAKTPVCGRVGQARQSRPPLAAHSMGFPSRGTANGGGVGCELKEICGRSYTRKIRRFGFSSVLKKTF